MTAANTKDNQDDGDPPAKAAAAPNGDASAKSPKAEADGNADAPPADDPGSEKKDAPAARKTVKVEICGVSDVGVASISTR